MKKLLLTAVLLVLAATALAQNTELAVTVGGYIPRSPGAPLTLAHAVAIQGNFAQKIIGVPLVSLYFELPIVAGFNTDVASSVNSAAVIRNYSSLFITPGVKLKLAPSFPISPYAVADVGWARFKGSSTLAGGTTNPNEVKNTNVFAFGGGLDMKIAPFLSFRGEVRDFYSGLPSFSNLSLSMLKSRQHNLVPSGGLVLRF